MRNIVGWRLILTVGFVALLSLGQFLFREDGMAGATCLKNLADPSAADSQTTLFPTLYGFPLTFVTTFTEGCFEKRTTQISHWNGAGLLVDLLFVGGLGSTPYWAVGLWRRFRRREVVPPDLRG
jgi:hypothetical protein